MNIYTDLVLLAFNESKNEWIFSNLDSLMCCVQCLNGQMEFFWSTIYNSIDSLGVRQAILHERQFTVCTKNSRQIPISDVYVWIQNKWRHWNEPQHVLIVAVHITCIQVQVSEASSIEAPEHTKHTHSRTHTQAQCCSQFHFIWIGRQFHSKF